MSCCENRNEFLLSKVRNMRNWLHPWVTPQLVAMYDETKIVGFVSALLLPLHAAGKLDEAVAEVMKHLVGVPDEEVAAVRIKVGRYLACFCEAMI
jgi:hypothetical protein